MNNLIRFDEYRERRDILKDRRIELDVTVLGYTFRLEQIDAFSLYLIIEQIHINLNSCSSSNNENEFQNFKNKETIEKGNETLKVHQFDLINISDSLLTNMSRLHTTATKKLQPLIDNMTNLTSSVIRTDVHFQRLKSLLNERVFDSRYATRDVIENWRFVCEAVAYWLNEDKHEYENLAIEMGSMYVILNSIGEVLTLFTIELLIVHYKCRIEQWKVRAHDVRQQSSLRTNGDGPLQFVQCGKYLNINNESLPQILQAFHNCQRLSRSAAKMGAYYEIVDFLYHLHHTDKSFGEAINRINYLTEHVLDNTIFANERKVERTLSEINKLLDSLTKLLLLNQHGSLYQQTAPKRAHIRKTK